MNKPVIVFSNQISITSKTCCGSSSTLKKIEDELNDERYEFVSVGEIMRAFARSRKMEIEDFIKYVRKNPQEEYDRKCDDVIKTFGKRNWVVAEGRLAHFFMKRAYKVNLRCDIKVRAERRAVQLERTDVDQVTKMVQKRDEDDTERYKILYPNASFGFEQFNLNIDTDHNGIEAVVDCIRSNHATWITGMRKKGLVYDHKFMMPTLVSQENKTPL